MKIGIDFNDLIKEVERREEKKIDYIVNCNNIKMEENKLIFGEDISSQNIKLRISDDAHKQIALATKIPFSYYERLKNSNLKLLADNVNHGLKRLKDTNKTIRTLDGKVRAFLSDSYKRIDHKEVLDILLPTISKIDEDFRIDSCNISDKNMYIKITIPKFKEDVEVGDAVNAGLVITNSEIGLGKLDVKGMIYRLVCTNGLTIGEQIKGENIKGIIHKGAKNSNFILESSRVMSESPELKERFVSLLNNSLQHFSNTVEKMQKASEINIEAAPETVVENLGKEFNYSAEEQKSILGHLLGDKDYSKYGLVNAITRTAQDLSSYERASLFERDGYRLLTISPRSWKKLNETVTVGVKSVF